MTLADQMAEWGRLLEEDDPTDSNARFDDDLFYIAYNMSMRYICKHANRKLLRDIEELDTHNVVAPTNTFTLPAPAAGALIRITALSIGTAVEDKVPCMEVPISQRALVLLNSLATSNDTYPRYYREANTVVFLHKVASGKTLYWTYIKPPRDVSDSQSDIDIPDTLHLCCIRMSVDYARYRDKEITHEEMIKLWQIELGIENKAGAVDT